MGVYTPYLDSRDIVAGFYPEFEASFAGSYARQLAWLNPDSVAETEYYKWLGGAPKMRQWIGGRQEQGMNKFEYSLRNVAYEATLAIQLDDLRRDKTGQIRVRIAEMAMEAARHDETMLSTLITANGLAYDGKDFFDTDHNEWSTDQTNLLTATEIPAANVSTATAPTAVEMSAILLQVIGYFYSYVNDKGQPRNGQARQFTAVVGTPALYGALVQAVNATSLAGAVDNPLRSMTGVTITPIFDPTLAALTDDLYVFRTDGKLKPFILQYETNLETQLLGAGSEEEFKNDRHVFGLKWVKAAGYGLWSSAIHVTLS